MYFQRVRSSRFFSNSRLAAGNPAAVRASDPVSLSGSVAVVLTARNNKPNVTAGGIVTKYPYSIMTAADVKRAADMKGKRVILPFPKDLLTIVWNRWLKEKGMRPDDVEQMYAGATPNRLAARRSR